MSNYPNPFQVGKYAYAISAQPQEQQDTAMSRADAVVETVAKALHQQSNAVARPFVLDRRYWMEQARHIVRALIDAGHLAPEGSVTMPEPDARTRARKLISGACYRYISDVGLDGTGGGQADAILAALTASGAVIVWPEPGELVAVLPSGWEVGLTALLDGLTPDVLVDDLIDRIRSWIVPGDES